MIDFLGAPELLIILVIVVLLFGPGRLAKTMGEIEGELIPSRIQFHRKKIWILYQRPAPNRNNPKT